MKPENNLEDQVIGLPHRDRARIALKLIESLEPGRDEDVSELWLDEAERRLAVGGNGFSWAARRYDRIGDVGRGGLLARAAVVTECAAVRDFATAMITEHGCSFELIGRHGRRVRCP